MASDLVGLAAIVILAGGAYILLSNPNIIGGNQPANGDPGFTEGTTSTDTGTSTDTTTGTSSGGADCGKLCRLKDCKGYKANCKTGCTYCCNSGPNSKPCSGSTGGGTFPGNVCPSHATFKNGTCTCNSGYKASGGNCVQACPSGFSYSGGKCTCSRTSAKCSSSQVARLNNGKCVCTSCSSGYKASGNNCVCGQLSCCGGCPSGKRKVMNNGKCGCESAPSPIGGGGGSNPKPTSDPCKGLTGATYTACRKAHGFYARALMVKAYHARPNQRLGVRMTIG